MQRQVSGAHTTCTLHACVNRVLNTYMYTTAFRTRGLYQRFTEEQQVGARCLLAAWLAGCVCSVLTLRTVCSCAVWQAASAFGM